MKTTIGTCLVVLLGLIIGLAPAAAASSDGRSADETTYFAKAGSKIEVPIHMRDASGPPVAGSLRAGEGGVRTLRAGTSQPYITHIWPTSWHCDVNPCPPAWGMSSGGQHVSILGGGFTLTVRPQVDFGGAAATVVVLGQSDFLEVLTPPHDIGLVDVTVRNPDGGTATVIGGYTYTDGFFPQITSISPSSGPCAGNQLVHITGVADNQFHYGVPFRDGVQVFFGGVAAAINFSSTHVLDVYTPAQAYGLVDVTVRNIDTTEDTLVDGYAYTDIDLSGKWQRLRGAYSFTPSNLGSAASGPCVISFYKSIDKCYGSGDRLIRKANVISILGHTSGGKISVKATGSKMFKYFIAVIDSANAVVELSEENNLVVLKVK